LLEGGINEKSFKQMVEISREIKEQLDYRISQLIATSKMDVSFFIQHPVLYKVAKSCNYDYRIDADLLR
jgi:hypothetical protein